MTGISYQVLEGSIRPCDECVRFVPFDNPDADWRGCAECVRRIKEEIDFDLGGN